MMLDTGVALVHLLLLPCCLIAVCFHCVPRILSPTGASGTFLTQLFHNRSLHFLRSGVPPPVWMLILILPFSLVIWSFPLFFCAVYYVTNGWLMFCPYIPLFSLHSLETFGLFCFWVYLHWRASPFQYRQAFCDMPVVIFNISLFLIRFFFESSTPIPPSCVKVTPSLLSVNFAVVRPSGDPDTNRHLEPLFAENDFHN